MPFCSLTLLSLLLLNLTLFNGKKHSKIVHFFFSFQIPALTIYFLVDIVLLARLINSDSSNEKKQNIDKPALLTDLFNNKN